MLELTRREWFIVRQRLRQGPLSCNPLEEQVEGRQDVPWWVWWQLVESVKQLLDVAAQEQHTMLYPQCIDAPGI